MDRDVLYGLVGSTIFLTLLGAFYLTPSRAHVASSTIAEAPVEAPLEPGTPRQYSPEDVRYKFEQKAKKLGKRRANPVVEESSPTPESSENEAPPIDDGGDDTAEEPPIE